MTFLALYVCPGAGYPLLLLILCRVPVALTGRWTVSCLPLVHVAGGAPPAARLCRSTCLRGPGPLALTTRLHDNWNDVTELPCLCPPRFHGCAPRSFTGAQSSPLSRVYFPKKGKRQKRLACPGPGWELPSGPRPMSPQGLCPRRCGQPARAQARRGSSSVSGPPPQPPRRASPVACPPV